MGDTHFNYSVAVNLAAGTTVVARLSGLPGASNRWALLWVVLVVLAAGFSFAYLKRRGKLRLQLQPVSSGGGLEQRRQKLLVEIARLDDDFDGGRIEEEVYRRQRAVKKAQLVRLIKMSKGVGDKR